MTGFGASGPQPALYEHFGFTPEHVAERGRAVVERLAARHERSAMSVEAQVNERLAALTAAGTSVWLDQIRRSLITGGELERLDRRGLAARRDLEPGDLREGDPRLRRLRRADRASSPREGLDARGIYEEIAIQDVQIGCDVLRPVWDDARRRATASCRSRWSPPWRTTPTARIEQARDFWRRVDRPNLMIKIPGTEEGVPAIEEAIADGHQRERDAAVLGRVVRRDRRGLHPRHGAAPATPASRWTCTRWRASSSRAWTPRSTSASRRSAARTCAAWPAIANARAAYHALQGDLPRRALRRAARRRRAGPAPALGLDRGQGPAVPGDQVRGRASSRPHTVNTMPMPTLLAVRRAARGHGRDGRPGPDRRPARRSPTPASTWAT